MTGNVVKFGGEWFGKIPADMVLQEAIGKLEAVLIIGVVKGDSDEPKRHYACSDQLSLGGAMYEMELFKHKILAGEFG